MTRIINGESPSGHHPRGTVVSAPVVAKVGNEFCSRRFHKTGDKVDLGCSMASWTGKTGKARAKACREKAALNARAALAAMDPDIKASYQDIAIEWRELAAQFEEAA